MAMEVERTAQKPTAPVLLGPRTNSTTDGVDVEDEGKDKDQSCLLGHPFEQCDGQWSVYTVQGQLWVLEKAMDIQVESPHLKENSGLER